MDSFICRLLSTVQSHYSDFFFNIEFLLFLKYLKSRVLSKMDKFMFSVLSYIPSRDCGIQIIKSMSLQNSKDRSMKHNNFLL